MSKFVLLGYLVTVIISTKVVLEPFVVHTEIIDNIRMIIYLTKNYQFLCWDTPIKFTSVIIKLEKKNCMYFFYQILMIGVKTYNNYRPQLTKYPLKFS